MAKYTREQRQRAVELYVKYEGCAADVIRELGYPSREALRMWHRDWLDEQETGVLFCFNVCSTGSAVFFRSVG